MVTDALKRINKLLAFAWENKRSAFYRNKFETAGITRSELTLHSANDLAKLPLLTKGEFYDLCDRRELFVPESEVHGLKYSTGTAGKPHFTFYRKMSYRDELTEIAQERRLLRNVKRVFCLVAAKSVPPQWELYVREWRKDLIVGEPANPSLSAALFTATRPQMIICPTKKLLRFAELLNQSDRDNVQFIRTKGDKVSLLQHSTLSDYFRNAKVLPLYTPTDAVSVAVPCPHLLNDIYLYHVSKYAVVEIVDLDTQKALPPGNVGEVVVTKFRESRPVVPLIRYRTGDVGEWLPGKNCRCGRPMLKVVGRLQNSIARLGEFIYRRENLELALTRFANLLTGNLTVEITQTNDSFGLAFYVEVAPSRFEKSAKQEIEDTIYSEHLFHQGTTAEVGRKPPTHSVSDLRRSGTINGSQVIFVDLLDDASPKCRDIVDRRVDKKPIAINNPY